MNLLGDALFTTTQKKVLGLLYSQPERSFYMKEILRLTGMGVATIKRELDRMLAAGILSMTKIGNQHHYQANPDCPIYEELLVVVRKTCSRVDEVPKNKNDLLIGGEIMVSRDVLQKLAKRYHIDRLVLFGSAARGELKPGSDIDLLVEFASGEAPSLGGMVKVRDALVSLFGGRQVDLATPSILENPYRRREIEKSMEELYAA